MCRPLGSRYFLCEILGRGGMGTVFRGSDTAGAQYAIKVLRPELAADPGFAERFARERSILLRVRDPHVVRVHDLVLEGDTSAIVMELVPGRDLRRALIAVGTYPPAEVARLGAGVAAGLVAVHREGIVHRDIKPANVLLDSGTEPATIRLTDFGIARLLGPEHTEYTTVLLGCPPYLAPEVAEGQSPEPPADMYALGVMLYQLSCGVCPFVGEFPAVMRAHIRLDPGRPAGIPDPMWRLLCRLMDKNPGNRPVAELVRDELAELSERLAGEPAAPVLMTPPEPTPTRSRPTPPTVGLPRRGRSRWRPILPGLVAAAVAVIIFVVATSLWPPDSKKPQPPPSDPAQFVLEYYKLLPGNDRDLAWSRLTPAYRDFLGGRKYYDDFYNTVRTITFDSGPTDIQDGRVLATIRFHYVSKPANAKAIDVRVVGSPGSYRIDSSAN